MANLVSCGQTLFSLCWGRENPKTKEKKWSGHLRLHLIHPIKTLILQNLAMPATCLLIHVVLN